MRHGDESVDLYFPDEGEVIVEPEDRHMAEAIAQFRSLDPAQLIDEMLTFHPHYGYIWRAEHQGQSRLKGYIKLSVVVMGHNGPFRDLTQWTQPLDHLDTRLSDCRLRLGG